MTTIIDGSAGITYPNSTLQASAGVVLQVVNATYSTSVSTTTNTFVTSGLTASITPKFTNSKVLVIASINGIYHSTNNTAPQLALYRGGIQTYVYATTPGQNGSSTGASSVGMTISYLDSPASISSLVYAIYFNSQQNNATAQLMTNGDNSSLLLMEIAG